MHQRQNAKGTLVDGGVANISLGRSVHDVSNLETLHGLILAHEPETRTAHLADATTAVGATDGVHVTSSLLGTTVISTRGNENPFRWTPHSTRGLVRTCA